MNTKSAGGVIFLSAVGVIVVGLAGFFGLTGYYMWQFKYGNATELQKQFTSSNFTVDTTHAAAQSQPVVDVKPFTQPFNPTIGKKSSPVTIVEFIDFECPFCQQGYPLFKKITDKYEPVIRVVFKHFPVLALHPNSMNAANAAACVADQNGFWAYYDNLFTSKNLSRTGLIDSAKNLASNTVSFTNCLDSAKHQGDIDKDTQDGLSLGVRGTPTYFVNNTKIEGVVDEATWDKIILNELKKTK